MTAPLHPAFHHVNLKTIRLQEMIDFDPARVVADHADGMSFAEIHAKAMAGGYAPEQAPVEIPEMSS